MRKYLKIITFAFCISLCSCLLCGKVDAATQKLKVVFLETGGSDESEISSDPNAKYNVTVDGSSLNFEALAKMTLGGHIVYCIEPYILTGPGVEYESGNIRDKLTASEEERLERIAYVGYGYNGDTSNEMIGATQIRIWQELGYTVRHIHKDLQAKINQINKNLKMFNTLPSFNGQTVKLDAEKTGQANATVLTDTNRVFSRFDKNIKASAKYSISGNNLSIWREKTSPMSGTYTFDLIPSSDLGNSEAYFNDEGLQTVAHFEMSDEYRVTVKYTTEPAKVRISKLDITSGEELAGSHLSITDKASGKVIEEWVSDGTVHVIDGDKFVNGKEYILHEELAPEGYDLAHDITFIYRETGMETIIMNDELTPVKVIISKVDITTGEELPGSKLWIKDKDTGEIIEEWTSTDEPHEIDGHKFEDGKEYILHEETAPEGYLVAQDITFTYNKDKMDVIVMADEIIPENPETGLNFPYIMLGGGVLLAIGGITFLIKKNKFKSI